MATNLLGVVGPDALKTVLSPFTSHNQWMSAEKMLHTLISEPGIFEFKILPNDSGTPIISSTWQYHVSNGGPIDDRGLPEFVREPLMPWLEQNGLTNNIFFRFPQ